MKKENYNGLAIFQVVAQENSFTKAAIKLKLSQSTLSHRIKQIEAHLGIQLFARTTRSIALTQAGEQLFAAVEKGFNHINSEIALLQFLKSSPAGIVRITSSQYGISKILIPKLAKLSNLYPDIQLELVNDEGLNDIISEHFDAGVRWGNVLQEGMIAQRISDDEKMAIVGSPDYFQSNRFPKTIDDLADHRCLAYRFTNGSIYQWDLFYNGKLRHFNPDGKWVLTSDDSIITAAKLGVGLGYVPLGLVKKDIEKNELIQVLKVHSHTFTGFHLYYPHRNVSPALRVVIELLKV